jgi:hypothetical protein
MKAVQITPLQSSLHSKRIDKGISFDKYQLFTVTTSQTQHHHHINMNSKTTLKHDVVVMINPVMVTHTHITAVP